MKKLIILLALLAPIKGAIAMSCQMEDPPTGQIVTLKTHLLPGFLYFVKGDISVSPDSLIFTPSSKCFEWRLLGKIYPCHNELFKDLRLPVSFISRISRRNTLLLFPNKFIVRLRDGRKYKFFSYKRGKIIRAMKQNKQNSA